MSKRCERMPGSDFSRTRYFRQISQRPSAPQADRTPAEFAKATSGGPIGTRAAGRHLGLGAGLFQGAPLSLAYEARGTDKAPAAGVKFW